MLIKSSFTLHHLSFVLLSFYINEFFNYFIVHVSDQSIGLNHFNNSLQSFLFNLKAENVDDTPYYPLNPFNRLPPSSYRFPGDNPRNEPINNSSRCASCTGSMCRCIGEKGSRVNLRI